MLKVLQDSLEPHQIRNLIIASVCLVLFLIIGSSVARAGNVPQNKCSVPNSFYCPTEPTNICKQYACSECASPSESEEAAIKCTSFGGPSSAMLGVGAMFLIFFFVSLGLLIFLIYKYEVIAILRSRGKKPLVTLDEENNTSSDPNHHRNTWRLHRHNSHDFMDKISSVGTYRPPSPTTAPRQSQTVTADQSSSSSRKSHQSGQYDPQYHQPNDQGEAGEGAVTTTQEYDELVVHKDHGENSSIVV